MRIRNLALVATLGLAATLAALRRVATTTHSVGRRTTEAAPLPGMPTSYSASQPGDPRHSPTRTPGGAEALTHG